MSALFNKLSFKTIIHIRFLFNQPNYCLELCKSGEGKPREKPPANAAAGFYRPGVITIVL